jgi:glycosyltransferase involved in cell wall biosynthesis
MPIHVCVLTSVHQPFDGRIFYRECTTLSKAGYKVTLIAPADFDREERDGVTVLGVPKPAKRFERPLVWFRLFKMVRKLCPDVIHFHDPELLLLAPLFRLFLGKNTKIIYDVHEYFLDSLAVKYWIPAPIRPIIVFIAKWLEYILVKSTNAIICAVQEQRSLYENHDKPIAVVRNLPIANLFSDAIPHPALNVNGFKLVYVGLILPERGIDIMLEAMRMLYQQGHKDIYLYLIGPETSPAYIQEIKNFIQQHNLSELVHWLGYVPHDELKHYLSNSNVGMAPGLRTRQYDNPGISTKLFEYMLCGLPIISADHPHRKRYIDESNCGLTVPPNSINAHAQAIATLHEHPGQAHSMGQRGREMVLDHYIWEKEKDQLITFYKDICG